MGGFIPPKGCCTDSTLFFTGSAGLNWECGLLKNLPAGDKIKRVLNIFIPSGLGHAINLVKALGRFHVLFCIYCFKYEKTNYFCPAPEHVFPWDCSNLAALPEPGFTH